MAAKKKTFIKTEEKASAFTVPPVPETAATPEQDPAPATPKKSRFSGGLLLKVVLMLLVIIAIAGGIYFYLEYDKSQKLAKNPTLSAQVEQKSLIDKVGKLIALPSDEEPTIATVTDVDKLKSQPFFVKAENGFKVLIFAKAKKAILYDPKNNKIIEVGPINIGAERTEAKAEKKLEPVNVILYNGTKVAGLASRVEKELKEKAAYVTVVKKGNAAQDYTKTLVVDLTGKKKDTAAALAKVLEGTVGSLPAEETPPASSSADLLIILGR